MFRLKNIAFGQRPSRFFVKFWNWKRHVNPLEIVSYLQLHIFSLRGPMTRLDYFKVKLFTP